MKIDEEKLMLLKKDKKRIKNLHDWMEAYEWEVEACGRSGDLEMDKIKKASIEVLKILVNYL